MGPRPLGRGRYMRPNLAAVHLWRQWGRDLSAAEGWCLRAGCPKGGLGVNGAATSRPRKVVQRPAGAVPSAGVNGAATSRPRKGSRPDRIGAWPASVNGAATSRPRKAWGRRSERTRWRGVNGAATSRPRKAPWAITDVEGKRVRQWGRDLSAAEGARLDVAVSTRLGVNGAATSRPRKVWQRLHLKGQRLERQWGRDLSAAEGRDHSSGLNSCSLRQWGRDLSAAEGAGCWCTLSTGASVNGAATSRPRKAARPRL